MIHSRKNNYLLRAAHVLLLAFSKVLYAKFHKRCQIVLIIGNQSYLLFSLLILQLLRVNVAYDLNYPYSDLSAYPPPNRLVKYISITLEFIIKLLSFTAIFYESKQQATRFHPTFSRSKNLVFHTLYSTNTFISDHDSIQGNISTVKEQLGVPFADYIIFRGTLNHESGILYIIHQFLEYRSKVPSAKISLLIVGVGEYSSIVAALSLQYHESVKFINCWLPSEQLTLLQLHAIAVLGQYSYDTRCNFTIPHKFFEALWLRKLYLSPHYTPIMNYFTFSPNSIFHEIARLADISLTYSIISLDEIIHHYRNEVTKKEMDAELYAHSNQVLNYLQHINTVSISSLSVLN